MKWITFRDFFKRCGPGIVATVIAVVLFGVVFGIAALKRKSDNYDIRFKHERALSEWRTVNHPVDLKNATIRSLRAGKTSGYTPFDSADHQALGRFVDLVLLVTNGKTPEVRMQAYMDFLKVDKPPDSTSYGVYRGLTVETLTSLERYELLRSQLIPKVGEPMDFGIVDGLIRAWLKGDRPELEKLSEKPTLKLPGTLNSKVWIIFALVPFLLAQGFMAVGYFVVDEKDKTWAVPANPAGWLIILLFAPAFVVPWAGRGVYWVVLWPIGLVLGGVFKGVKWTLFDLDLSTPPRKVREWREARREQARRRKAEEQVRIAEQAAVGQDVFSARLRLRHVQELVALEKNKPLRDRLKLIAQRLEAVAQTRRSKQAVRIETAGEADDLAGLVEDLHMQVEGLEEAEKFDGSQATA